MPPAPRSAAPAAAFAPSTPVLPPCPAVSTATWPCRAPAPSPLPLPPPPRRAVRHQRRARHAPPRAAVETGDGDARVENVVIIGSGPAGYTAAIYAARANLRPLLLEGIQAGVPGGQLMTTDDVENFPGFPNGVSGPELMARMRRQALRWGARLVAEDAVAVDLDTSPFRVDTRDTGAVAAHAVIVATGASAKRLGVRGEDALWGRGISACAICDGAAPIYAGVPLAVVGGGDSACEEAVYLCKYASHVHLLVRGDALRASKALVDRVTRHAGVTIHFNTTVVEAVTVEDHTHGNGNGNGNGTQDSGSPLHHVRVRDGRTGSERALDVRGLFYAIGHSPNTGFLRGSSRLRFDPGGYLRPCARDGLPFTGLAGVFAAGDVADAQWRQAVTAAASGCTAALAAERFLTEHGLAVEYHQDEAAGAAAAAAAAAADGGGGATPGEDGASSRRARGDSDGARSSEPDLYDEAVTRHKGQFALRKLYHESKRPLIVKYVSPTCGPCRQLKPMLDSVIQAYEDRVHYVEIDMTKDVEIAEAAGVTGSPTVQIFHEKSLIKEFRGVKMKSEYRQVVQDILDKVSVW